MTYSQVSAAPKTVTTFIYKTIFDQPEEGRKPPHRTRGEYKQKITLLNDGSFFIEQLKDKFYAGYSPITKKYYFIDLAKKNKKEININAPTQVSLIDKKIKKCGTFYIIKTKGEMKGTLIGICIKKTTLASKFIPFSRHMIHPSIYTLLEKDKVYLVTRSIVKYKDVLRVDYSLLGKTSKQRFPYDPQILFGYKTLPGKCQDTLCNRWPEIKKESITTMRYKRNKQN